MTTGHGHEVLAGGNGTRRASDADRERAVDVLKAALAEGRLAGKSTGHESSAPTAPALMPNSPRSQPTCRPGRLARSSRKRPVPWRLTIPRFGSGPTRWPLPPWCAG